jgi:hypothetical protein
MIFISKICNIFMSKRYQIPPTQKMLTKPKPKSKPYFSPILGIFTYDHSGQRASLTNNTTTTYYPSKNYNIDTDEKETKHIFANDSLVATVHVQPSVLNTGTDPSCEPPQTGDWTITERSPDISSSVQTSHRSQNPQAPSQAHRRSTHQTRSYLEASPNIGQRTNPDHNVHTY